MKKSATKSGPPRVGILMGSDSDWEVMSAAARRLTAFGVPHEIKVTSAHRSPAATAAWATSARKRGLQAVIVGAGAAAHLAGVVAAHTALPVIGVPLDATSLRGLDALLATVQMPSGVPILALSDAALARKFDRFKADLEAQVEAKNARLQAHRQGA